MSVCTQCGTEFLCGMADATADQPCWCTALPALPAGAIQADAARCLCPDCLRKRVEALDQKSRQD